MGKHAYLIIAHNNFELLKNQISLLRHSENDIYVHLDKKANVNEFRSAVGEDIMSIITMVKRVSVKWGGYSQIQSEMNLLKAAVNGGEYEYLHLLSGVDLPIKSQEYIHNFFTENKGKEFLYYDRENNNKKGIARCKYYFFLQNIHGKKSNSRYMKLEYFFIKLQKKIGVNRVKDIAEYVGKGANWLSITGEFAKYVVNNEKTIKKHFRFSFCSDEVFMHTMFNMSPFKENLYTNERLYNQKFYTNFRCCDWKRGNPYVFRNEDLEMLVNSEYLFARKFDQNISVEKLENLIDSSGR